MNMWSLWRRETERRRNKCGDSRGGAGIDFSYDAVVVVSWLSMMYSSEALGKYLLFLPNVSTFVLD